MNKQSLVYIEGKTLESMMKTGDVNDINFVQIDLFCRVSPEQKEIIVNQLKKTGKTFYCGDGTNDMGALKASDSGLALLPYNPDLRKKLDDVSKTEINKQYSQMMVS